jgi:hypothetical protein
VASVTITIEDTDDGFKSHISFDPELESVDEAGTEFSCTQAQKIGFDLYERLVIEGQARELVID